MSYNHVDAGPLMMALSYSSVVPATSAGTLVIQLQQPGAAALAAAEAGRRAGARVVLDGPRAAGRAAAIAAAARDPVRASPESDGRETPVNRNMRKTS